MLITILQVSGRGGVDLHIVDGLEPVRLANFIRDYDTQLPGER